MLYVGALHAAAVVPGAGATASLVVVPTLALTGAIACACFVRTYGIIFLGIPAPPRQRERTKSDGPGDGHDHRRDPLGRHRPVADARSVARERSSRRVVRANVDPAGVVDGIAMAARVTALLVALVIALGCVRKLLFEDDP